MDAYKPYLEFILAGGVAETAYILTHEGAICITNLPIQQLPAYKFDVEDQQDPSKTISVDVDERKNLLTALEHAGVCSHPAGVRLYNQKYYAVSHDPDNKTTYFKKSKGGACVAQTGKLILIGTFNSEIKMSNGVNQNPGELNKRIESLASNLKAQGY